MEANQPASNPNQHQPPEETVVKHSRAMQIWFFVIAVVLSLLLFEMQGQEEAAYNVLITVGGDVGGSQVKVDGVEKGKLGTDDRSGLDGHNIWLHLKTGKHTFELTKDGKSVLSKEFEVHGKEYLRFDSGNASEAN